MRAVRAGPHTGPAAAGHAGAAHAAGAPPAPRAAAAGAGCCAAGSADTPVQEVVRTHKERQVSRRPKISELRPSAAQARARRRGACQQLTTL